MFPGKRTFFSTVLLSGLLTACGGGGGGGGSDTNRNTQPPIQPLTTLPSFLQGHESQCTFIESGTEVSLEEYRGDLAAVTELECTGATLNSLSGIELLINLEMLQVPDASLTNVDALLTFTTKLTSLNLSGNPLADLSGVSQLTHLETLDLSETSIIDVAPLASLVDLKSLNLSDNAITDLSNLFGLQLLEHLQLNGNAALSCSEIVNLRNALETAAKPNVVIAPVQCATALVFNADSPDTTIVDNSQEDPRYDRVVFTGDLSYSDLMFGKLANDLVLTLNRDLLPKTLTFTNWYVDSTHQVDLFEMPNGVEATFADILLHVPIEVNLGGSDDTYIGTDGIDIVDGGAGNDTIRALGGDDVLQGGSGNDTLIGGAGANELQGGIDDDLLIGGSASFKDDGSINVISSTSAPNTYIYNLGGGNDTIIDFWNHSDDHGRGILKFGPGITPEMITRAYVNHNMILYIGDQGTVTIYKGGTSSYYRSYLPKYIQFDGNEPIDGDDFYSSLTTHQ